MHVKAPRIEQPILETATPNDIPNSGLTICMKSGLITEASPLNCRPGGICGTALALDYWNVAGSEDSSTTTDIEKCVDSNARLSSAAEEGDAGTVSLLLFVLDCPALDVNRVDLLGRTPLSLAARAGHALVVRALLAHGEADVNAGASSPLSAAAYNNHTGVVAALLESDSIDVDRPCRVGETPLYVAARKGHAQVVKLLVQDARVSVNQEAANGDAPLVVAAKRGRTESVRLLLYHPQIDVNRRTADNTTALNEAAYRGFADIVSLLIVRPDIDVNQGGITTGFFQLKNWPQNLARGDILWGIFFLLQYSLTVANSIGKNVPKIGPKPQRNRKAT